MNTQKINNYRRKILILACCVFTFTAAFGQDLDEKAAVRQVIERFFQGMKQTDSLLIKSTVRSDATLKTVFLDKNGVPQLKSEPLQAFITAVGTPHEGVYDEKIWSYDIKIDGLLATAWTEYSFYFDQQLLHCGVNAFELFKAQDGWKIIGITDTRRKENCQKDPVLSINAMLDAWHKAAAAADAKGFFGQMTQNGIYIGTDASERWQRDEFEAWAKPFFERGKAWDFKPIERQVYLSDNKNTAWFDETLDTWMGVCRSSGVVEFIDGRWLIQHYHLSITVPNDAVKDFLELMKKY